MVCHTCGLRQKPPLECPVCRGFTWRQIGYGIDRVASEFSKRFPRVPILKLDQDTEAPDHVIAQFASLTPSCLLCTQMVLGFECLSGVIFRDNLLSFPDYRHGTGVRAAHGRYLLKFREILTSSSLSKP